MEILIPGTTKSDSVGMGPSNESLNKRVADVPELQTSALEPL